MISLQTNVNDLILQRTLYENTFRLDSTIERMSTGLRINQARDNAAGVSIQTDLNRRISSLLQTKANTEDGISLLQTAEGGLAEMKKLLSRLRELTIQASDGVYDSDLRAKMQEEADQIVEELDRLKKSINYDGRNIYEASATNPVTTAVDNLADAVVINNLTTNPNTFPQPILNNVSGVDPPTSGTSSFTPMSYSTPRMMSSNPNDGIALMSLDDGVSPVSTTIEGAVDLAASETQTIMIDGVQYTIKNNLTTTNSLSYIKDTTTGQITFNCNNFTITGQSDVAHNLVVNGQNNYVYGGNENDMIKTTSVGQYNYIYGDSGEDVLTLLGVSEEAHGGNDKDLITLDGHRVIGHGDAGDDILEYTSTAYNSGTLYGDSGNDILNAYAKSILYGGDDNDSFNIYSGDGTVIDGGTGTNNILTDNGTNTTAANVVGSNKFSVEFAKGETKTLTINNIEYTISHWASSSNTLIYEVMDDGQIVFSSQKFTIKGDVNKAHNVSITDNINFYGGNQSDKIVCTGGTNVINTYGGNDIISNVGSYTSVYSNSGNNEITLRNDTCKISIITGDGEDKIYGNGNNFDIVIDSGGGIDTITGKFDQSAITGSDGNDNINITYTNSLIASCNNSLNNASSISIAGKTTEIVNINGINYLITNAASEDSVLVYSYDTSTGITKLGGQKLTITVVDDSIPISTDVILYGKALEFHGGKGDDTVEAYCYGAKIYGGDGNDNIIARDGDGLVSGEAGNDTMTTYIGNNILGGDGNDTIIAECTSTSYKLDGEGGDDTYIINKKFKAVDSFGDNIYYINTDGTNIISGGGNDTFYVNGDSNNVLGAAGNDYFVVEGSNNTLDGGTGTNYYVDTGSNNTYTNVVTDPNSGTITFSYSGQNLTREINGKNYTFTNNGAANNSLSYAVNQNTGEVILTCSDVTVLGADEESHNLVIKGSNNIVNGGNLADRIVVEQGSNNTLNGNGGNDTLINNDVNNSINGGDGDDTITLNSSTNLAVTGGAGADVLEVVSNNNTNVSGGAGDDRVSVNGTNNTVKADDGNNVITINGNSNTVSATTGNNRLLVNSSDNTVNLGSGANTYGISGDNNNVTIQNATGNVSISGTNNTITQVGGNSNVSITGTLNNYSSTLGAKNIDVYGDGNTVITGNENDVIEIQGNSNSFQSAGGSNKIEVKGNNNQIQGGTGVDTIKLNGLRNTALGGDGNDAFTVISGDENTIDGEGGDRNTIVNRSKTTSHSNAIDITPKGFELKVKVDIGSGDNKYINTTIGFDLMGLDVDFSTQEKALDSLELIDELIKNIDSEMLHIGMTINRLESVMEEQTIRINNMISSRSTLCDADIAEESSKYLRYQILQNAAATLLASSRNLRAENVLGLLEGLNR